MATVFYDTQSIIFIDFLEKDGAAAGENCAFLLDHFKIKQRKTEVV
jgi:hypothetical protein